MYLRATPATIAFLKSRADDDCRRNAKRCPHLPGFYAKQWVDLTRPKGHKDAARITLTRARGHDARISSSHTPKIPVVVYPWALADVFSI